MNPSEDNIPVDRTLEISENVLLIWGSLICNSPVVLKDHLLSTRCHRILDEVIEVHSQLKEKQ